MINNINKFIKNKNSFWLIYFIALNFGLYTILSTNITYINFTEIGLLSKFNLSYWIGLFLVCFLLLASLKSNKRLISIYVLVLFYLFFIPTLIQENQGISWVSYYPSGEVKLIQSQGYLISNRPPAGLMSYHSWPAFIYFSAILTILVKELSIEILIKYFPLVIISSYGLFIYMILKCLDMKNTSSLLGAIWFISSFWLGQHYFGPQGMVYILYLMVFFLIFKFNKSYINKSISLRIKLFIVPIFAIILFYHGLTPLLLILGIFALYTIYSMNNIFSFKKPNISYNHIKLFLLLFVVLMFSYNTYIAYEFFDKSVEKVFTSIIKMDELPIYKESQRVESSFPQKLNYFSSMGIVAINLILFFMFVISIIFKKIDKSFYNLFCTFWVILILFFSLSIGYGHEAPLRAFMFGLIPLTYISIVLLKKHGKILSLILIILIILHIPADYGADSFRVTTTTELSGTGFFVKYSYATSCFYLFPNYIRYHDPNRWMILINFLEQPIVSVPSVIEMEEILEKTDCLIDSNLQNNYYYFYMNFSPIDLINLDKYKRIYDNGRFRYYDNFLLSMKAKRKG